MLKGHSIQISQVPVKAPTLNEDYNNLTKML